MSGFVPGGARYLATPAGAVSALNSSAGAIVWRDGDFYLLAGDWVFRIVP
jgi:hypothetical protein